MWLHVFIKTTLDEDEPQKEQGKILVLETE
jgi:hypothetical protein